MTNFITILHTRPEKFTTKTFERKPDGRIKELAYDCGSRFTSVEYEVSSVFDIYGLLTVLQDDPRAMIIRGQRKLQFVDYAEVTRTKHDDPSIGQRGMFEDFPDGLNWLMMDFDKIDLPTGVTPLEGIEMLIQRLPAEFHDVSYCYQFSSSAGVRGVKWAGDPNAAVETYAGWAKISAHVFFWQKRPTHDIAQWAKNLNAQRGYRVIDPAPLHTVQPNYTARPIFIGMDDPLGADRLGIVRKDHDEVDLVWVDAPVKMVKVKIGNVEKTVAEGSMLRDDGVAMLVTRSLEDRLAMIGAGNEFRDPLKAAIGYYFWYHGTDGSEAEIKRILRERFPAGIKDYLDDRKLNEMVRWFAVRNTHPPVYQDKKDADALAARLVKLRDNAPALPDMVQEETYDDWLFDMEDSGLQFHYGEGECGQGKTETMIDLIGNKPDRYIICLPRIELIREVSDRLERKYPDIENHKGYVIKTIYTQRDGDIRDEEDAADIHSQAGATVRDQLNKFHIQYRHYRHVVVFITHAALLLMDWHRWDNYHLIVDEIPDPYATYTRNFRNTSEFVKGLVETNGEETNYYQLGLTDDGHRKVTEGEFDDNEAPIRGLLESINTHNAHVFGLRRAWDGMAQEAVQLMRLTSAGFLRPFRTVTFMGDEFRQSTLALAFENKYAVDWKPHPAFKPTRQRKTPLKDRVRLFYFATKDDRRGSVTHYTENKLIPKILKWFDDPANDPGQVLITSNRRFEHCFEKPKMKTHDEPSPTGMERVLTQRDIIGRLWVPPKLAGTDIYKDMSNVGFFAAMRPGGEETDFVSRSLLITEEEIIRWREYNALYQFVMRICLRKYDSDEIANVYVFDQYQAEYLRERFGGCVEFTHIDGVCSFTQTKGGRPAKNANGATSPAERKRAQREREREAKRAEREAKKAADLARNCEGDVLDRLANMMRAKQERK